jgi:hypothetical protein
MKNHLTHLNNDELVDLLYGVGAGNHLANHINDCRDCSERLEILRERRATAAEPVRASWEFLAAQRRNVYARMGEAPRTRAHWVPALAAAVCLIAVGLFSYHPEQARVVKPEVVDTQLFVDVYSMEQSMEPIAAQPIHALFEQDEP